MSSKKNCFVIAPIGDSDSGTRKRSDQVLKHIIDPAVSECGYKPIRADDIEKPGIITSQVIQHIVDDPLVIADLTERNPNVFYELAIRHAIAEPCIQIIASGEQIPFDVAPTRVIFFDHHDLDSVEEAKQKIVQQIRELEADPSKVETPISLSLDLQHLRQSEKPEDRSLADILAEVSSIRGDLGKIGAKFDNVDDKDKIDSIQLSIQRLSHQLKEDYGNAVILSRHHRQRLLHKTMDEVIEFGSHTGTATELLFIAAICRDTFPWVYELVIESYRLINKTNKTPARAKLQELQRVLDFSVHSRWVREYLSAYNEDTFMLLEYMSRYVGHVASRIGKGHSS